MADQAVQTVQGVAVADQSVAVIEVRPPCSVAVATAENDAPLDDANNNDNDSAKTPPPAQPASASASARSESKSLESEAKDLLNRVGLTGVGRRCAEYKPSLDELKSTTFSDYVRGEVLGVPLPGYEFLYIYEDSKGQERKREVPMGQVPPKLCEETQQGGSGAGEGGGKASSSSSSKSAGKKEEPAMRTRSQSRAIEGLKKGGTVRGSKVVSPKANSNKPRKYQMCWHKVRDGIAKVSLPTGFWARIDTTARGRHVSTYYL